MSVTRVPAVATGGVLALSLVLTGCGSATTATAPASSAVAPSAAASSSQSPTEVVTAQHNDADVTFAQRMIPHHQQAIEMAEIATDNAQRAEVKSLAEQIRTTQGPEITQLTDFLTAWGEEAPAPGSMSGGMGGMDHSGMTGMNSADMLGMMTDAQMQELRNATGTTFDTTFLKMMIEHHRGAVSDAQQEVDKGSNPQAEQLAAKIVTDQNSEIGRMQQLLG